LPQSNTSHEEPNGDNLGISSICGNVQCCKAGYPNSLSVSLTHTSPDKQGDTPSCTRGSETTVPTNSSSHTRGQGKLLWWSSTARTYNSAPLIQPSPDLVMETDASLSGWGARCQDLRTQDLWSVEELKMHINALELLLVFMAVKTLLQREKPLKHSDSNRQHDCQGIYQSSGRHPLTNSELHSITDVEMVPGSPSSPDSRVPTRSGHQNCRWGVQSFKRSMQLYDPPTGFWSDKQNTKSLGGGHVCFQTG